MQISGPHRIEKIASWQIQIYGDHLLLLAQENQTVVLLPYQIHLLPWCKLAVPSCLRGVLSLEIRVRFHLNCRTANDE